MRKFNPYTVFKKKHSASFLSLFYYTTLLIFFSCFFHTFLVAKRGAFEADLARVCIVPKVKPNNLVVTLAIESPLPQKGALLFLEEGLTAEDDEERRNTGSDFFKTISGNLANHEVGYNNYLKHRFLHLNSLVKNRPAIPFFILYHSWKSDLA
jgi:hypothetical protein